MLKYAAFRVKNCKASGALPPRGGGRPEKLVAALGCYGSKHFATTPLTDRHWDQHESIAHRADIAPVKFICIFMHAYRSQRVNQEFHTFSVPELAL